MRSAAEWWGVGIAGLAAFATVCPVIVALSTARNAGDLARELRRGERKVELAREQAQRRQLSLAFEQELYMMQGQLEYFDESLA